MATLTETIREELRARKVSLRKVHLATGAQRATVKRFLEGAPVTSDTLDALASFLGTSVSFARPKEQKKPRNA